MNTKKRQEQQLQNKKVGEIIKFIEKLEEKENLEKLSQKDVRASLPNSRPTQGTTEVRLPLSYRQLPRI